MDWNDIKLWLEISAGIDKDALHVHAGALGQVIAALLMRRSLASPLPWLAVLVGTLANEAYDLRYDRWPDRALQVGGGIRDVWNTMLLPSAFLILTRLAPSLFVRQAAPAPSET